VKVSIFAVHFATTAALPLVLPLMLAACSTSGSGPSTQAPLASASYNDFASAWAQIKSLADRFPGQAQALSVGRSWEGRDIPALSISEPIADLDRKPNIYIVGGMHANERIGVEVPLGFAQHVLYRGVSNPEIRRVLQQARFYVVPILNPDGLEYYIRTGSWYKNRRDNGDGTWGVNLNNNFPLGWDCTGAYPASPSPISSSPRYRGMEPFSEPESQAIRDFMLSHPPAGLIDYHCCGTIIYPTLPRVVSGRDIELWHTVEPEMARRMSAVSGRVYTASGSDRTFQVGDLPDPSLCAMLGQLFNWTRDRFETSALLIELPPGPSESGSDLPPPDIDGVVAEQIPAILHLANYVIEGTNAASAPARSDTR
jgi:carboxypeptidase T